MESLTGALILAVGGLAVGVVYYAVWVNYQRKNVPNDKGWV